MNAPERGGEPTPGFVGGWSSGIPKRLGELWELAVQLDRGEIDRVRYLALLADTWSRGAISIDLSCYSVPPPREGNPDSYYNANVRHPSELKGRYLELVAFEHACELEGFRDRAPEVWAHVLAQFKSWQFSTLPDRLEREIADVKARLDQVFAARPQEKPADEVTGPTDGDGDPS